MSDTVFYILSFIIILGVLYGIKLLNSPKTAVKGNLISAISMLAAILLTVFYNNLIDLTGMWISLLVGGVAGVIWASKVKMIQMPQLVAAFNGFGGASAMIVGILIVIEGKYTTFELYSSLIAIAIGSLTFIGSMIATGKLAGKLSQKPVEIKSIISVILLIAMGVWVILPALGITPDGALYLTIGLILSAIFGAILALRVGGADMPIIISLLISFSGIADAIAGLAISDPLLVSMAGVVGASGLILTQIMCNAMNRRLIDLLTGKSSKTSITAQKTDNTTASKQKTTESDSLEDIIANAKKAIIVPGYGMALAQAQSQLKQLADLMESKGIEVDFAIHPVAGRMPGHMNVLLAEVDVDYGKLREMDDINPEFDDTDLVIVVGANDVVNSAANTAVDTPIYGLPILNVDHAKHVIVVNYDDKPGYAGVDNPLYTKESGVTLLWGDAKEGINKIINLFNSSNSKVTKNGNNDLSSIVNSAKKVIIVPGYGMALAQAQTQVKQLADLLTSKGAQVDFAIHPVAGRMPGHMNVLLAEVDVDYEKLREMDDINPEFDDTDLVIVVGANDVVNSAANTAVDTPIYGLPILNVDHAKHVIVVNYDDKPGYAGVDNPLYTKESGVTLLWGDAKEGINKIIDSANSNSTNIPETSSDLSTITKNAKKIIIVPGYGMALAQAQTQVKQLADLFENKGAQVDFAIHPVAGRMPGHMNVLLAEVDVDYEKLREMDDINPEFDDADLVIVVGANDVVNSAANTAVDTPIYGLPILNVDHAKHVIVVNYDDKPGYAGVDNPLYTKESGVTLLWGDAKDGINTIIESLNSKANDSEADNSSSTVDKILKETKKTIIVPGYGMALAQAQAEVKQLGDILEKNGSQVDFAIHPVAGRMPGHMNVLLAEVDVDYEKLREMDDINPEFDDADLVIVVGANDVVNSAANTAVDTPIYGLPILNVDHAKHVIVCNFDDKPGYAGVDNPLYTKQSGVTLLWGDAKASVQSLIQKLS